MRAAVALALRPDAIDAAREAARTALRRAGLKRASFALVVSGPAHRHHLLAAVAAVSELTRTHAVIGAAVPTFLCLEGPGIDEAAPLCVSDAPGLAVLVASGSALHAEAALLPDAQSKDLARAIALTQRGDAGAAGVPRGTGNGGASGPARRSGGNGHAPARAPGAARPATAAASATPPRSAILLAPPLVFRPDRFAAGLAGGLSPTTLCGARLWAGPPEPASRAEARGGASGRPSADLGAAANANAAEPDTPPGGPLVVGPGKASGHRVALLLIHQGLTLASEVMVGAVPVGSPTAITRGGGRFIESLGGRSAVTCLEEALGGRPLASADLLAGVAPNPKRRALERADFTVMPIASIDAERGAIEVDGEVRLGQTFAFLRREPPDAREAEAALRRLGERAPGPVFGLYCGGYGGADRLGAAQKDLARIHGRWPDLPLLGFLSDGELAARPEGSAASREGAALTLASPSA